MKRALLVIDVQNEYFTGKLPITYPEGSLEHILQAIRAARSKAIPVAYIQHTAIQKESKTFLKSTDGWQLHPAIAVTPRDYLVEKTLPGSFTGTDLDSWLRQKGIDTVVITGYMTQMCCDSTAREGFHRGYKVEFLSDATGTLTVGNDSGKVADKDLHNSVLVTQASMFSKVMNTADWIKKLDEK